MKFRILGPVEVHDERTGVRILPTGAKQRALLGALVVKSGQIVSVHRLIDELWGEQPPANATNALQAHVARLRRLLPVPEPGSGEPHHEWIVTRSLGYVLRLGRAGTDADRFHRLAAQGRAAAATDPEQAAELLRQALALWRGPALEGSVLGDICAAEAAQLEENRLTALEALYDACLRAARHGEITGELEELTTDHPMRERFYDLLMLALYRCGRQAEALSVYDRARRRLVHELGVEPGPALRGRMEAILQHDPQLAAPGPTGQLARVHPMPLPPAPTPGPAGGPDATVLNLTGEIARLRSRIEHLSLEQEALMRRFDQLVANPASGH
ncbi:AfsR/SARP family transcriptional regulator [Streptomyces sp. Tu 2975]|uniref:AfsR/SARP family transcriptional regulator n=1 Tax=Streptomyces sp. Tu 2975 TaxID=2676871 RepID=UPI0013590920|nr:AfsR/SARP family transcriptional regulator [Streptomyces sp. Tu 2975]QIP82891.1 AfsR/SARP family transcriptional regulator [Streptomyces sp. Tu 2975]